MGKRLFIAADIDEATREQVGRISSGLRSRIEARTKASWVPPDRVHLTLHFFGNADAPLEQCARMALAKPIDEPAFDISFHGLGFFPERGSPRVLWLSIRDGLGALGRVQAALGARLTGRTPTQEEGRSFTPHLTLARLRARTPRAELAEIARIPALAGPSRIDRVTLYESRLSPASLDGHSGRPEDARRAGPTYLPLAEALLRT